MNCQGFPRMLLTRCHSPKSNVSNIEGASAGRCPKGGLDLAEESREKSWAGVWTGPGRVISPQMDGSKAPQA